MCVDVPMFCVIVPTYNRKALLDRCVASVVGQSSSDWELIIIDDGSTDDTHLHLRDYTDPRIRSIRLETNRGVCPARNVGVDCARGAWLIFLDSDDEFYDLNSLEQVAQAAERASDLDALWFRCILDDGSLSPAGMTCVIDFDYIGYLKFLEDAHLGVRDMIRCVRRSCFERLRYPENRMLEEKFHLDFARIFRSRAVPTIARRYHQDAPNQLVKHVAHLHPATDADFIRDRADGLAAILKSHGEDLRRYAPRVHRLYQQRAIKQSILAGRRRQSLRLATAYAKHEPRLRSAVLLSVAIAAATLGGGFLVIIALVRRSFRPGGFSLPSTKN